MATDNLGMPLVQTRRTGLLGQLEDILESHSVRSVYQPIVDLGSGAVVAYEALARGPQGSDLERPDHLFAAARSAGLVAELDWECRAAAVSGALEAGLREPLTLFVNVEPAALHRPVPHYLKSGWGRAKSRLRIVLEITERALTDRPTELLWSIGWARELGWGIAVDDVGADPRALAMLPFLRPDVIKLDLRLVRGRPDDEVAGIAHAVGAESERTGAAVLAEGIETTEYLETARALGATLGQGWHLGRPGELPSPLPSAGAAVRISTRHWDDPGAFTPFDIVSRRRPVRRGRKSVLLALSRSLERHATALGEKPVVMSAFQNETFFTPASREVYERLAKEASFVAALGVGLGHSPAPGVRGARLSSRDPLRGEWVVVVVGPHFSAVFAARDLGDEVPDRERRFDYALTYERDLVLQVARSLMSKIISS